MGVQTRKLYEPVAYLRKDRSGAASDALHNFSWVTTFQQMFSDSSNVCSFGFEANERHTPRLHNLQACYQRKGHRARFFTETAASDTNGTLTFYRDPVFAKKAEWAASLMRHGRSGGKMPPRQVAAVDLAAWIAHHILQRRIPHGDGGGPPQVVMKLDIEGAEYQVLRRMLELDTFCNEDSKRRIQLVVLEWHLHFLSQVNGKSVECESIQKCVQATQLMQKVRAINGSKKHCTKFVEADDDSYMFDSTESLDLSTCS